MVGSARVAHALRSTLLVLLVWAVFALAVLSSHRQADAQTDVQGWVTVEQTHIFVGRQAVFVFSLSEPTAADVTFRFYVGRNYGNC